MAAVVVDAEKWTTGSPVYYMMGIGNHDYAVYNAGSGYTYTKSTTWSVSVLAPEAIRFEVRKGDTQWYDTGTGKERSEVSSNEYISYDEPFHISYKFTVEPGPKNTAVWVVAGQFHDLIADGEAPAPPSFGIELKGEKMMATVRYRDADGVDHSTRIFLDTDDIVRGKAYSIDIYGKFSTGDDGRLVMVRDGAVVGEYSGKFGYGSTGSTYWQYGIYRYGTTETLSAVYADMSIDLGDAVEIPGTGLTTYVPAPAPTLALDGISNSGANVMATFKGATAANSTVKIFDGEKLIATTTADASGNYSAVVQVTNATHFFTAAYIDVDGHLSRTSKELPIDSGPAADVMGRMNYVVAMDSLKAIVLTDTHSLPVTSIAQMKAMIAGNAATLALVKDGYNFSFWSGFNTYRTLAIYDKTGVLVEKNSISIKDNDIVNITHNVYTPGEFVIMEIANFHITGQAYTWAFRQFTTGNKTVTYELYRDDGSLVSATYTLVDGTKTVRNYDAAGVIVDETITLSNNATRYITYVDGHPTTALITNPDGSTQTVDASDGSLTVDVHPAGTVDMAALAKAHFGDDIYIARTGNEVISEGLSGGLDQLYTALQRFTLNDNVEALIFAGSGDAVFNGNAGDNLIKTGAGNDRLDGLGGADTLIGYAGNDIYIVDNKGDVVVEAAGGGNDLVRSSVTYTLSDNVEHLALTGIANINATGNALGNTLTGNDGNNMLDGEAGADVMAGGGGTDTYIVDDVGDVVTEGENAGDDIVLSSVSFTLDANVERLVLTGMAGIGGTGNDLANVIIGNASENVIDGKGGADIMLGGKGNDTYIVDDMSDAVAEDADSGNDLVVSRVSYVLADNLEALTLTGDDSNFATGNSKDNIITGNTGVNIIDGASGADTMIGGDGNDIYIVDNSGDAVQESANGGDDSVISSVSFTLADNVERLVLAGSLAVLAAGNGLDNILIGNAAANTLDGKGGADIMMGGTGDDIYMVNDGGDITVENADEGANDHVISSISYALADNVEMLTLSGTADIDATGNGLANILVGNSGKNVLDGDGGADIMVGGEGGDIYVVDNSGDVIVETGNGDDDLVLSSISIGLGDNLERLTLTGDAAISGAGNALDNVLMGNEANNILDGGTGADTMAGGNGNDTYIVDDVADVGLENDGEGSDLVQSSVSFVLGDHIERLTLTGGMATDATGNGLDNTLIGNNAANTLDGGAGADTMIGGHGDDIYIVNFVSDLVIELSGGGYDTVVSSIGYALSDYVDALILTGSDALAATGNRQSNLLVGNSGDNILDGGLGADVLQGGVGNDTYAVDSVDDVVTEQADSGDDLVQSSVSYTLDDNVERLTLFGLGAIDATGNSLANTLVGNGANNVMDGGAGADTMIGATGNDTYVIDNTGDVVIEQAAGGDDLVHSSVNYALGSFVERLTLTGMASIEATGNDLANVLTGNGGDNILDGRAGADMLVGGAGNDVYVIDTTGDTIIELAGGGIDFVKSAVSYTLADTLEQLTLTGSVNLNGTGNVAANVLTGNGGDNTLDGGAQNDTLDGGAGNDRLIGGTGVDSMFGGQGDDIYVVDDAGDLVTEDVNGGTDTVQTSLSAYTLSNNVERLIYAGTASFVAMGNASDNSITTGRGADKIDGGAGTDKMSGGIGNDTYTVDNAGDQVIELAGQGIDRILSRVSYILSESVEDLTLLSSAQAIKGIGNALDNTITGNGYANVINGAGGTDILWGGVGNDTFEFKLGEANGDQVMDFTGAGSALGDMLVFSGYGAGTLSQVGSTDQYVVTADAAHGGITETIRIVGVTSIDRMFGSGHNDILFV